MSRPRLSLSGLMALVLVLAIGVAALRDASETWAGVVLLLTLGLLGVSVFGVIYRREARRAWWLGFAQFRWLRGLTLVSGVSQGYDRSDSIPSYRALTVHLG